MNSDFEKGINAFDQGEFAEAAECFRRAADSGDPNAVFNFGNALSASGDLEGAKIALERAAESGVPDAWFNLGQVLESLREIEPAREAFVTAAEVGDQKAPLALAFMLKDEDSEAARAWLGKAEAVNDATLAETARDISVVWQWEETSDLSLRGRLFGAVERCVEAEVALGEMEMKRGDIDSGLRLWRSAASKSSADALIRLGNYYWEHGSLRRASTYYADGARLGDENSAENLALLQREIANDAKKSVR